MFPKGSVRVSTKPLASLESGMFAVSGGPIAPGIFHGNYDKKTPFVMDRSSKILRPQRIQTPSGPKEGTLGPDDPGHGAGAPSRPESHPNNAVGIMLVADAR
jgi:hypothetical protein